MATRSRALPVWMKKKKETEEERRKHVKRKPERAAFYCMNEEELTRAAAAWLDPRHVTLLTDPQVEEKPGYTTVNTKRRKSDSSKMIARLATEEEEEEEEKEEKEEKKEEGSSDYGDSREESTYVSESDSDLTEAQTVLYTEIPQYQGSEGQRSEPDQDHSSRLQVEDRQEEEEDDALGLVREIFFT